MSLLRCVEKTPAVSHGVRLFHLCVCVFAHAGFVKEMRQEKGFFFAVGVVGIAGKRNGQRMRKFGSIPSVHHTLA